MLLVNQAEATPDDAWFRTLERDLRAFIRRRVEDPSDAEDVLQEVLLRVVRGLPHVADEARLGAWVHSVARNAVIDHYRRPRREVSAASALDERVADEAHREAPSADSMSRRLLAAWLPQAIAGLPEPYRGTLRATELEGRSYAEVAQAQGVSVSAVKSRVQRGRAKLRGAVERCCQVDLDARGGVVAFRGRRCGCGVS